MSSDLDLFTALLAVEAKIHLEGGGGSDLARQDEDLPEAPTHYTRVTATGRVWPGRPTDPATPAKVVDWPSEQTNVLDVRPFFHGT